MLANFNDVQYRGSKVFIIKIKNDTGGKRLLIHSVVIVLFIVSIQINYFFLNGASLIYNFAMKN